MDPARVAIVHDHLETFGGPERVLEGLHRLYPQAPIYTAQVHPDFRAQGGDRIQQWDIRPLRSHQPRHPWIPEPLQTAALLLLWEGLDLQDYDLVISSTEGGLAHSVRVGAHTLHVCYCHTPDRRRWDPSLPPERWLWNRVAQSGLRQYDFYAAQRVDRWVTNCHRVARRVDRVYGRSPEVISPPVKLQGYGQAGERYYLYMGHLDRPSRVDLLIQACNQLQRPLQIVGTGPEEAALKQLAGPTVEFLGVRSDHDLLEDHIYANAMALIVPALAVDFHFGAVEALGRGLPVIAYAGAGLAEVVLHYRTGLLFQEPTLEGLCGTIEEFERLRFFSQACIDRAEEFAETVFASKFSWYVAQALDDFQGRPGIQRPVP
ncbi:MAG: glycosyltransferase [Prochlorothrix sp.]|nr:glycosyltransferase [Prochlorothrix sp.]